jgi:hypothetical protein
MRTHGILGAATLGGALLFLPGCFDSDDSPAGASGEAPDQEAIEYVVLDEEAALADPDVLYWDDDASDADVAAAPIRTMAWRRELLFLEKTVTKVIDLEEGTASVKVEFDAEGILHLWACADSERVHVTKDFADHGIRSMLLQRFPATDVRARNRGWRLVALSGVLVESPGTTRRIASVRIQSRGVDETITNVTDLVRVQDILTLPAGAEVAITVDTGDASDQVYLHLRHRRARMPLSSNGDGTFSGRFLANQIVGPRHLVVDVLSEGTLYDDRAPYDNVAWGIPWRIVRPEASVG